MSYKELGVILNQLDYGITVVKGDKLIYANDALERIFGYSKKEISQGNIMQFVAPEDKEKLTKVMAETVESRIPPKVIEYWIVRKDGTRRYIRDNYIELKDKDDVLGHFIFTQDITEEKEYETKMFASELKKSRFLDYLSEQIIYYDTDLKIIWANKAASDSLDLNHDQIVGRVCHSLWYDSDTPCENCPVLKAKVSGKEEVAEVITPDKKIWHIKGYPVYSDDGILIGVAELATDITEDIQTEQELYESEERFKRIFNNINDCIFVVKRSKEGEFQEIIEFNEVATKMYGYTRDEFLKMRPSDFNLSGEDEKEEFTKELLEKKNLFFERQHKRKDGSSFPVEIGAHLFTLGDDLVSLAVVRDLTRRKEQEEELKESEENYRNLFHNSNDMIAVIELFGEGEEGIIGNFIEVNNVALEKTGYSREEALSIHPKQIIEDLSDELIAEYYDDIVEKQLIMFDKNMVLRDGIRIPVEVKATFISYKGQLSVLVTARDISERKEAERELKESEEKYRSLIETSPDAIVASDLNGDIIYANNEAAVLYGIEKLDQLIGRNTFEFIAPEDLLRAQGGFKQILAEGYVRNKQFSIIRKDGSRLPVETSASVTRDVDGNPNGFIAITRDVSEHKKTEKLIKESEERFRQIFHNANDAIFIHKITTDGQLGEIIEVNNIACSWTGYSREKLLAMKLDDADRPNIVNSSKNIGKELLSTGTTTFESVIIHKDGTLRPVEFSSRLFLFKDEVVILSVARDITERRKSDVALKESEEKFRQAFNQSNDGIFLHDLEGNILDVNLKVIEQFGYNKSEITAIPITQLHSETELEVSKKAFEEVSEKGYANFETEFKRKDQSVFPAEVSSSLFEIAGKKIVQGVVRDITERKLTEQELQESEESFRQIFHNANDAIFLTNMLENNATSSFVEVNDVACTLLEYSREELLEFNSVDITAIEDQVFNGEINKEISTKGQHTFETVLVSKSGKRFPVEIKSHMFDLLDEKVVVSLARDITERKKAEEELQESETRYRQVFNNANDIIAIVSVPRDGSTGTLLEVNDVACQKLMYSKEDLLGLKLDEIVKDLTDDQVKCYFKEILEKKIHTFYRDFVTTSGETFPVEIKAAPFSLKGELTVLITARDITERMRDEELKRISYAQMEKNIENFDILVNKINNPLTAIIGYSELAHTMHSEIIIEEANKISEIMKQISESWVETEKFREILRRHLLVNTVTEEVNEESKETVEKVIKE
ncbi:MAG: PAS domain S-box protein [Candidatus Heimdallarchaeaceae archaeon]|jgi:PAS domain S-box-containing protein